MVFSQGAGEVHLIHLDLSPSASGKVFSFGISLSWKHKSKFPTREATAITQLLRVKVLLLVKDVTDKTSLHKPGFLSITGLTKLSAILFNT